MTTVTGPSVRLLFCEGQPDSLDSALLNRIKSPDSLISPVGGKYGMGAFIQGRMASYKPDQCPDCLGFRDRDFDMEPPANLELIRFSRLHSKTPIWLTYRACVESYFIDAELLHDYWTQSATGPLWQHGPTPQVQEIQDKILQAARELADYQATRWALAKLKPGPRWPEIETTWTDGSGHLPRSLAFNDCLAEANRIISEFIAQVSGITIERFEQEAEEYRIRFTQDDFYSRQLFLIWFHGKDLLTQLSRHLASNFSHKHYAAWAVNHISLGQHLDLQQLSTLCGM